METWTITFGDCVENHHGMEILGEMVPCGFTRRDLEVARDNFVAAGYDAVVHDLATYVPLKEGIADACLLVVKKGARALFVSDEEYTAFLQETKATRDMVDRTALMRGRVVNKHARWNLCYGNTHREPNIEKGQGTVVAFPEVPMLQKARDGLPGMLGTPKASCLLAELNYYYNVEKCGIGYHGDSERRLVVGIRVGATMPLHYQWHHHHAPLGDNFSLNLEEGDMYVMGEKAVGADWKRSKVPTLRHAAGCSKYTGVVMRKEQAPDSQGLSQVSSSTAEEKKDKKRSSRYLRYEAMNANYPVTVLEPDVDHITCDMCFKDTQDIIHGMFFSCLDCHEDMCCSCYRSGRHSNLHRIYFMGYVPGEDGADGNGKRRAKN